ncbi:MAG: hypothetical protein EB127_12650, partial [Alphaproteobacteria bacterium]|nr:hypothetical protein [Alphaproteobacteria bacterium]
MNIDSAIFIGFLLLNLAAGLFYSRGVTNIREYAIGNKQFSTPAITATIVATFIGGGSFSMWTSGVYKTGLYHMLLGICDVLTFYVISYVVAPRCGEFLGKLSIAEAMESLYGSTARTITAIVGMFRTAGAIAMQFKVGAILLSYAFHDFGDKLIVLAAFVVIIYSTLGGIRAVIMTDIIQLLTFVVFIPTLAFVIWNNLEDGSQVITTLTTNPVFDYRIAFGFNTYIECINLILIPIVFLLPHLDPAVFQRIAMAKNVNQVRQSFFWAGLCVVLITFLTYWIAILLLTETPQLNPDQIIPHLLENYTYVGLRGIMLAGIIAILISTADSYLNAASVLFAHDIMKPFGIVHSARAELFASRIASLVVGIIAIILATSIKDMLSLILFIANFYVPFVTVPLYLAIAGFRSSFKSISLGMAAGIFTSLSFYLYKLSLDPTIPAMLANALVVFTSHYLLKEPGGWVGIKDKISFQNIRQERRQRNRRLISFIRDFNLMAFLKKNTPKNESIYFSFGLFSMASMFCIMHSIPKEIHAQYSWMSGFIFNSVLFIAAIFLSYPAWPQRFKNQNFIAIIWNIGSFYIMIFAVSLLVIISNFAQLPMMIFMINFIIISALMPWQTSLLMLAIGVYSAIAFFKWYVGIVALESGDIGLQFKFIYALLLMTSSLIMFLKPKQEYQELTEEKADHLAGRIDAKDEEVRQALALKGEFIRNVTHEYHAPMTGVMSMIETLHDSYHKLSEDQRIKAIEVIFQSAHRLKSYDENIATLSALSKGDYNLRKEEIDFSELLLARINSCRKLYEKNTEDRVLLEIEEGIVANLDKNYITQLLDNLIINSINYCKKGKIHITLTEDKNNINLIISDQGIGIPKNEL